MEYRITPTDGTNCREFYDFICHRHKCRHRGKRLPVIRHGESGYDYLAPFFHEFADDRDKVLSEPLRLVDCDDLRIFMQFS